MVAMTVALLFVSLLAATPVQGAHTGAFTSRVFRRLARVDGDRVVPLVVALKPGDFAGLEERLWKVSDPRHAEYGRHLTREQADALAAPHEDALHAVREWIRPHLDQGDGTASLDQFSTTTNMLKVELPARRLEQLLQTELHEYEYAAPRSATHKTHADRRLLRASQPLTLPSHLRDVISFLNVNMHPLHLRALAHEAPSVATASTHGAHNSADMLAKIRSLYGIPDTLVATNPLSSQAFPSFYSEAWSPSDLTKFFKSFLPDEQAPEVIAKGDRENRITHAGIEASLDVQYLTGVARNATTSAWTMGGRNPFSDADEPFVEFAEQLLQEEHPPLVVSISYSDDEEHIFAVSREYALSLDTLLIKMGLRGMSILIASGDDGVSGLRPEFEHLVGDARCAQNGPQWPTSSPYVTAVGATMMLKSDEVDNSFFATDQEVICSGQVGGIITTGGAFSNIYASPAYQREAVARYLTSGRVPQKQGFFNASGRAYPDISALGADFMVFKNGAMSPVSGTSAATPVVAGMTTLWNDQRLNDGLPPLGFLNPLLYHLAETHPEAFHDIIVGNNGASKGTLNTCADSFGAASGWDAVSGVGTPNFPVIAEYLRTFRGSPLVGEGSDEAAREALTAALAREGNESSVTCGPPPTIETSSPPPPPSGRDESGSLPATALTTVDTRLTVSGSPVNVFQVALIVAGLLASVMVVAVVGYRLVRRWRHQYASLTSEHAALSGREDDGEDGASSTNSPVASRAQSTRSPGTHAAPRTGPGADAETAVDSAEMSEINLAD